MKQSISNTDGVLSRSERMTLDTCGPIEELTLAKELIPIYDSPYSFNRELRAQAACLVGRLASRNKAVLDLVIDNAKAYGKHQHICDADPYSPNSFELLGDWGNGQVEVITFLESVVNEDCGVPRSAAVEALSALRDDPLTSTRNMQEPPQRFYHPIGGGSMETSA